MGILRLFSIKNYAWKVGVIEEIFVNTVDFFFFFDFLCQTVPIAPDQNVSILSDQNMLILLVSNMHNGNIGTLWHRRLCMVT